METDQKAININMTLWELTQPRSKKLPSPAIQRTLPGTWVLPNLPNQDPYLQYRMGLSLASARAQAEKLIPPQADTSAWGEDMVVVTPTAAEQETLDLALQQHPHNDGKQAITTRKSQEPRDTQTQSPVRVSEALTAAQSNDLLDQIREVTKNTEFQGRLYLAGGYVRDKLLGRDSKDIDFLVTGGPSSGLEAAEFIARQLGVFRAGSNPVIFPTYYTAKLTIPTESGSQEVEFVAPRRETYTPGSRKPSVSSGTLEDDVTRRDFTINSLLENLHTGEILDVTGRGLKDLQTGVLNTTGDPGVIFGEDPLRILRAVRFAIKYQLKMPLYVIKAIKAHAESLNNISMERINSEISKILVLNQPSRAWELFRITGILKVILPELQSLVRLRQNAHHHRDAFGHTLDVLDASSPELVRRLAALFHDIGKASTRTEKNGKIQFIGHDKIGADIARTALIRLKYPRAVINRVHALVANHMDLKSAGPHATALKDSTLRAFIYRVGHNLEDILDLIHADNLSHAEGSAMPDQIKEIRKRLQGLDVNQILHTQSVLNGDEIRALGAEGALIGKIKDRILDKTVRNPNFSRQEALNLAQNLIQAHQSSRQK